MKNLSILNLSSYICDSGKNDIGYRGIQLLIKASFPAIGALIICNLLAYERSMQNWQQWIKTSLEV